MSEEDYESPGPRFLEESTYHSASLSRGQVHEGTVRIAERGSVITWDFDVMKQDVVFSVFRLKASPVNPPATGGEPENNHESPPRSIGAVSLKRTGRRVATTSAWRIPLFVTMGSPYRAHTSRLSGNLRASVEVLRKGLFGRAPGRYRLHHGA
ncbi:Uncharacterized protein FKW44_023363 [Caligus rogercresseyi]|uniref:GOLD domain-containing protein n=1 Tax=Caligus rogercresseyi TaxID=217165 RepID=A0A7T8GNX7_CALRO|nr:Uncharacterized protein FKW44_023363 [Caligus rogercresseyi]